jgi:hypothetical protein
MADYRDLKVDIVGAGKSGPLPVLPSSAPLAMLYAQAANTRLFPHR